MLQYKTSIGTIMVRWSSEGALTHVDWYGDQEICAPTEAWGLTGPIADLVKKMDRYFSHGEPIGELPWDQIDTSSWSEFQRMVYRAITFIPHGETRTYGWVAARISKFAATRAVGQALRKNPLPILVPCHRVVAAHDLGGFMGAIDPNQPELQLKSRLIQLEDSYRSPMFDFLGAVG